MTTVTYLRTALADDSDFGAIARQREACLMLCHAQGWVVEAEYVDNGQADATGRVRPGYDQLVRDIEAGEVGRVVTYAVDRLARSQSDIEALGTVARRHGVEFHTMAGPIVWSD